MIVRTRPAISFPERVSALVNDSLQLLCVVSAEQNSAVHFNWLHGQTNSGSKHTRSHPPRTNETSSFVIEQFTRSPPPPVAGGIPRSFVPSVRPNDNSQLLWYGSKLQLTNVNRIDAGVYVCEVYSRGGNLTLRSELLVSLIFMQYAI